MYFLTLLRILYACVTTHRYLREMVVVQAQAEGATSALSGCRVVVTELSLHVPRGIKLRLTDLDITVLKGVVSSSCAHYCPAYITVKHCSVYA
jgi:hypothetical protein